MKKILFLVLPSYTDVYKDSKITVAVPKLPLLSIAMLLRIAKNQNIEFDLLDLSITPCYQKKLFDKLKNFSPEYIAFGFTTALYNESKEIIKFTKDNFPKIKILCGGVHPSLFPEDVINELNIDFVFINEAEQTLVDFFSGKQLKDINGLAYKTDEKIIINQHKNYIENLDDLPFPYWEQFDLTKYYYPKINVRKAPALPISTSRGCVFNCNFCTKSVHGYKFRKMSALRILEELEYLKKCGANEFHIWDDQFTTDLNRAKEVCELLLKKNLKMKWNLFIGVRVNSVDKEFLTLAKKSGLYQIAFAPESGNTAILNEINKKITLDDSINAFALCEKLGIETVAFFVIGFLNETLKSIQDTINFACKLNPDYAKVTIALPLPKTKFYEDLKKQNLIKSFDWSKYNFHLKHQVWQHPTLSWDELYNGYKKFYSEYYLRPKYFWKALKRAISNGTLFFELHGAIKTFILN
ncbi:MAG TPA: radical SAM protein [bacterium]|nr:radical SAM protein [bacterium]